MVCADVEEGDGPSVLYEEWRPYQMCSHLPKDPPTDPAEKECFDQLRGRREGGKSSSKSTEYQYDYQLN